MLHSGRVVPFGAVASPGRVDSILYGPRSIKCLVSSHVRKGLTMLRKRFACSATVLVMMLTHSSPIPAQINAGTGAPSGSKLTSPGGFAAASASQTPAGDPIAGAIAGPQGVTSFHPLVEESYSVTIDPAPTRDANGKDRAAEDGDAGRRREQYAKRQGYVLLHTVIRHPQPSLRHATARYEPLSMSRSRESEIRNTLAEDIGNLDFDEVPLRDVIDVITNEHRVPILIDHSALEAANISQDIPVTAKLSAMSLRSALRHMLGHADLTYVIKDEALMITTKEQAAEELEVRVYPISQFHGSQQSLVELIESAIAPETWDVVGGRGTCKPKDHHILVVSQTQEVHEYIEQLLRDILDEEFSSPNGDRDHDAAMAPTRTYDIRDAGVLRELGANLKGLCNAALGDSGDTEAVISMLSGQLIVQSKKRSFHVYAAELIHSINGVDVWTAEYYGVSGDRLQTRP